MICDALSSDHPQITDIATEVYGDLGDYSTIMPSWLVYPGVRALVDEIGKGAARQVRAFALLGFFVSPGRDSELLVDLLAIGVAPAFQRQGLGRALLRESIRRAREAAAGLVGADMRLTVSASNPVAQRLFSSEGFAILDPHHGSYDRGQRAIRMRRSL